MTKTDQYIGAWVEKMPARGKDAQTRQVIGVKDGLVVFSTMQTMQLQEFLQKFYQDGTAKTPFAEKELENPHLRAEAALRSKALLENNNEDIIQPAAMSKPKFIAEAVFEPAAIQQDSAEKSAQIDVGNSAVVALIDSAIAVSKSAEDTQQITIPCTITLDFDLTKIINTAKMLGVSNNDIASRLAKHICLDVNAVHAFLENIVENGIHEDGYTE